MKRRAPFLVALVRNWIVQAWFYLDPTELAMKAAIDILLTVSIAAILIPVAGVWPAFLIAYLIAHTLNWLFNGDLFVLLKCYGYVRNDPKRLESYLAEVSERARREPAIESAYAFGSVARGQAKTTSDIDVRIVRRAGLGNAIAACRFLLIERTRALVVRFPLDIYLRDNYARLADEGEPPVVLFETGHAVRRLQ